MNHQYLEYMLYDSDADPVGLPDGVLFLNEKQTMKMESLSGKIMELFRSNRYHTVTPPVFEHYETFEKGGGNEIARRSFIFKDREGKLLSLRYDMTTPIARMASMPLKFEKEALPLKFSYCGDVFREQPLHKGKLRQIRQAGIENIGDNSMKTDIEVISLLGEALDILSAETGSRGGYTVVLGDIQLYKHLMSQMELAESQSEAIHSVFDRKDTVSLNAILDGIKADKKYKDALLALPSLTGSVNDISSRVKELPAEFRKFTDKLLETLNAPGLKKALSGNTVVDFGLIKDFSYYSSITMEGFLKGLGYPVANGGRYDELFASFGKDHPATGFAVDLSYCI